MSVSRSGWSYRGLDFVWLVAATMVLAGCADDPNSSGSTGGGGGQVGPSLLVGNSRGDSVVQIDQETGAFLGEAIPKGTGGLLAPDTLIIGPDGDLYISSGDKTETSSILRFDRATFGFKGKFASGGSLVRPYGFAFGADGKLYAASFLTDELLRFDVKTGAFIDVFKTGDAKPGGLNGPNCVVFGPDGKLYVSTEGSVAVNGEATFPGLPSQVLRIDIETGDMTVFVDQPELSPAGLGYVSLLGVVFGPDCKAGACDMFVSDYANDVRRFDAKTGALKTTMPTNYSGKTPSGNNIGSLSFGAGGRLFTVGFNMEEATGHPGAVLRFDGATGMPLPGEGQMGAVLLPEDKRLKRPIGILALP